MRNRIAVCLAVVGCLAATVTPTIASAMTEAQAGATAHSYQSSVCTLYLYWCVNDRDPWPVGSPSGVNKAGSVQWWENGGIKFTYRDGEGTRTCSLFEGYGPNGGQPLVASGEYDCY